MKYGSIILLALALIACNESKKETRKSSSPRIKKSSSIISPTQNQQFVRGSSIPLKIDAPTDFTVDSVQVTIGNTASSYKELSTDISIPTQKVGAWRIITKVYSGAKTETHYRTIIVLPESAPEKLTYTVKNTYPHHTEDYTQGLLIKDGVLYESTGQRGESTFKKKELTSGKTLNTINLSSDYFGEGLAFVNEEFYQLTWTSGQGFVYNTEMKQIRTFSYQLEGWGLTTLKDELVLSDGSEKLYFIDPKSFTIQRELEVYDHQGAVDNLNELEVIEGLIYANIYQEDIIVAISAETGEVLQKVDLAGILPKEDSKGIDVLNGIAYDATSKRIFVTGKWWPKLFEITLQPKNM